MDARPKVVSISQLTLFITRRFSCFVLHLKSNWIWTALSTFRRDNLVSISVLLLWLPFVLSSYLTFMSQCYINFANLFTLTSPPPPFLLPLISRQDDGSKTRNAFEIATLSFSKEENILLCQVMKENFNIDCTVQKAATGSGHRIYIRVDSMERLRKLVAPYFILQCYINYERIRGWLLEALLGGLWCNCLLQGTSL